MLAFDHRGLLPPGDYPMNLNDLKKSLLLVGPTGIVWDREWRLKLVQNLYIMVNQIWAVGITEVFINGSFVEMKPHPNDIDGYFVTDVISIATGDLQRELNRLEPDKIWTWDRISRRPYRGYAKKQLPMWHKYRVELYPHFNQDSGIVDKFGNQMQFPAAFRVERYTYEPKGIIKIIR
jgi:hypothetical protein